MGLIMSHFHLSKLWFASRDVGKRRLISVFSQGYPVTFGRYFYTCFPGVISHVTFFFFLNYFKIYRSGLCKNNITKRITFFFSFFLTECETKLQYKNINWLLIVIDQFSHCSMCFVLQNTVVVGSLTWILTDEQTQKMQRTHFQCRFYFNKLVSHKISQYPFNPTSNIYSLRI